MNLMTFISATLDAATIPLAACWWLVRGAR